MQADKIALLLPEVIRRAVVPGGPLAALLAVMEVQHGRSEGVLDDLPRVFDPLRTEDRFVPMLARWVDLERLDEGGGAIELARMRLLVAMSARIGRRRGTLRGLLEVLTLATGLRGYTVDDRVPSVLPNGQAGPPRPFHIKLTVPAEGAPLVELVRAIVEQEKPAHLTAEVVLAAAEQNETEQTDTEQNGPSADPTVPMPVAGPVAVRSRP
jgi:phage tail-like protein